MWQDPAATLEHDVPKDSRERAEDTSIWSRKAEDEALRNIISKLSEERNLRDLHLKHYHMSTAQFKKKTTHLDIPENFSDHQHVVKICPFCISVKPRPERSRVSGLRTEEFGDLIFLDHGSAKIEDKTFGFLIILHGATSQRFLLALVDTASKKPGPDHSDTNHSCSIDAQARTSEKYTSDLKWQNAHGTGHGTKTERSPGPSFHESRTTYIYAN